jgi:hypothetical protein
MKPIVILLSLVLWMTTVAIGATTEFVILGGQKIKAETKRGVPVPASGDSITIQAAAFMLGPRDLTYAFAFSQANGGALQKVVVEDVSGEKAVVLVEDASPTLIKGAWHGKASPLPLTSVALPWAFEPRDSARVFRFTISRIGEAAPVVLLQPTVFNAEIKRFICKRAKETVANKLPVQPPTSSTLPTGAPVAPPSGAADR